MKAKNTVGGEGGLKGKRPPGGKGGRGAPAEAPTGSPHQKQGLWRTYETKRKAVRLLLEEGIPAKLVAQELGVNQSTVWDWAHQYQTGGEAELRPKPRGVSGKEAGPVGVRAAIRGQIVEIKRRNQKFGVKRIAQVLRRMFHLPASPETVRKTLHQAELIEPVRRKPHRNPSKPRFFERTTPNQLWQSDIFPFRLGGEYAYLIGFIDDHSRYITALEVFRGQTSENVLEVYRRGRGEYGAPKEMLTDNGRQYVSWRGHTKFQLEMKRDRIHHIRSQPHHPMTLGKIERFWKTIWEEYLERARFDTFEEARERIRWWVQYYNHQRPHQGIEGLCPADRFYAIRQEMREAIERGIEQNVKELALRGRVQTPFYMVGRMGEQSVMIKSEKGQVKLVVEKAGGPDDSDNQREQGTTESPADLSGEGKGAGGVEPVERAAGGESNLPGSPDLVGDVEQLGAEGDLGDDEGVGERERAGSADGGVGVADRGVVGGPSDAGGDEGRTGRPGIESGGRDGSDGLKGIHEREEKSYGIERNAEKIQQPGTMPGGVAGVDGTEERDGGQPGDGHPQRGSHPVAGTGDGRVAVGLGAERRAGTGGQGTGDGGAGQEAVGSENGGTGGQSAAVTAAVATSGGGSLQGGVIRTHDDRGQDALDHSGVERSTERQRCGPADGGVPEDLLQMGEPGVDGFAHLAGSAGGRTAAPADGSGETGLAEREGPTPGPSSGVGADPASSRRASGG